MISRIHKYALTEWNDFSISISCRDFLFDCEITPENIVRYFEYIYEDGSLHKAMYLRLTEIKVLYKTE